MADETIADARQKKIHDNERMSTSEALLEQLLAEDVDTMFGIPGSAMMDVLDITPAAGIRYVNTRHEGNAAHMADGYSQALNGRKVPVLLAQNGPGVTNFVTGVKTAQHNHSPLIALTPRVSTSSVGTDAIQEADTLAIFEDCVGWQQRLEEPDRIAELTRTAFRECNAGMCPVQIDIPRNFLVQKETTVDILPPQRYRSTGVGIPPEPRLEEALDVLEAAQTPAIISGRGVRFAEAFDEVGELSTLLHAPVCNTWLNNDSFRRSHPHFAGNLGYGGSIAAMELVLEADVIVAVGTQLTNFGLTQTHGLDWFPEDADILQINVNPRHIARHKPVAVGLLGDAKRTTRELVDRMTDASTSYGAPDSRSDAIREAVAEWKRDLEERSTSDDTPIQPRRAIRDIWNALPDGTVVAMDGANTTIMCNAYLEFEEPGNFISPSKYAPVGFGFPAAIGAKIARPDDTVVGLAGDGGFGMSLPSLLTAIAEDVPVTGIVFNNAQWGSEKQNQNWWYEKRYVATDLPGEDFAAIAEAVGATGISVTAPGEVGPAVREAIGIDHPTVVDITIDGSESAMLEPSRRDKMASPLRHLDKYKQ